MSLNDSQKQQVAGWVNAGAKLAEIQKRIQEDFGLGMTYMEVKFLVGDLDLTPKDPVEEKPAEPKPDDTAKPKSHAAPPEGESDVPPADPGASNVTVVVDQIARPGAMISGKVTFPNGKTNEWMLDQMGRLGVVPGEDDYKPSPEDLQEFQLALQIELQKMGY